MRLLFVLAIACSSLIEVQPLICKLCSGSTCNPTNTTCVATVNRCQTTSTILRTAISARSTLQQGCEETSTAVSFNSGGGLRFSNIIKFCTTDCCNTQLTPDPENTNENGLTCMGCSSTTEADCTMNLREVKCVGTENQCLNATGTQFITAPSQAIVFKGCATATLCTGTPALGEFLISLPGGTQCSAATGSSTTVVPTTPTTAPTTPTTAPTTPTTAPITTTVAPTTPTTAPITTTTTPTTTTTTPTTTTTTTPSSSESGSASSNSGESSD
ncbi:threonine-rich protein-like [Scyliorhinus canicula]|uniref:threonine-rich protein-like n=1 Tax=Scyliorhinus canicula TaxID=7830 RepID=UPI0018F68A43|nr:threonine-rich protein-like [Scyliorhinus canicula]